ATSAKRRSRTRAARCCCLTSSSSRARLLPAPSRKQHRALGRRPERAYRARPAPSRRGTARTYDRLPEHEERQEAEGHREREREQDDEGVQPRLGLRILTGQPSIGGPYGNAPEASY